MTTQMTIPEIERRLRFAAPDEPAVLPPLALPANNSIVRGAPVRLRGGGARPRDARFLYVVLALLLALALAIAAGAARLLDRSDPLVATCDPNIGGLEQCLPVAVPEGWVNLGEGQFQSGEFSEPGIGYAFVQQVMATTPLGACPTPGGPFPNAVPSGSGEYVEVPLPTPDAGLACLRTAQLPENAVRIVTFRGSRILGGDAETGGIPDLSEPTAEAGWTETVAGRPARLTIVGGTAGGPAETRIWDVLWPGSIGTVLRIRADIAGPDLEAGRAKARQVVDAVDFKWDVPALDQADADAVLRGLLDLLDRSLREGSHSDLYGCFPREPGSADATIRGSDAGPLSAPVQVTCSSRIEASVAESGESRWRSHGRPGKAMPAIPSGWSTSVPDTAPRPAPSVSTAATRRRSRDERPAGTTPASAGSRIAAPCCRIRWTGRSTSLPGRSPGSSLLARAWRPSPVPAVTRSIRRSSARMSGCSKDRRSSTARSGTACRLARAFRRKPHGCGVRATDGHSCW